MKQEFPREAREAVFFFFHAKKNPGRNWHPAARPDLPERTKVQTKFRQDSDKTQTNSDKPDKAAWKLKINLYIIDNPSRPRWNPGKR